MANSLNNSWFITISEAFTKWFVGGYNQVFTPTSYSNYLRNCRLENQWICMRDWFRVYTTYWYLGEFVKLKAADNHLFALVIVNNKLHLYKLLPSSARDLWEISSTVYDDYSSYDLVSIWDCLLILSKGKRPYRYREGEGLIPLPDECMPSRDGTLAPDYRFMSTHGVYYSWFVFINEIDSDLQLTNRVILSHEVNRDAKERRLNARDFSARRDADKLIIPSKIICPSAVQAMVSTQQNLYIFCQDSVQYLDRDLLMEYAQNKTLRTLPLASWNRLLSKNLCVAAGNYVFFMSKDRHIRTLWYTQGIYDPQIADITDTQFWIQKWINDNIRCDQPYWFAFFNKQDYTVEFHLRSNELQLQNDVVLIRDLQHQQWLIDTWKHFGSMENFERDRTASNWETISERKWTAHVVAGWGWSQWSERFYYQSDSKYDSDVNRAGEIYVNPIEFEYNTVNMALWEIAEQKLFNWVRLTWAINIHTGNTDEPFDWNKALFEVNVYVDGKQICNKKVNRQQIYDTYQRLQIEVGWPEIPEFDPEDRDIVVQYNRLLFPIDLVLDQWMVRRKWKRIRVQIKSKTPWADLYLSWLSLRVTPIGHFDLSDKF